MTDSKSKTWINVLPDMTKNINATVNRSIGMAPDKVTFSNVPEISARLYEDRETKPCQFSIGDHVRIPREKNLFSKARFQIKYRLSLLLFYGMILKYRFETPFKGYAQNWSDGIYTISKVQSSLGICYYRVLDSNREEVDRSFYESELNLVPTKK